MKYTLMRRCTGVCVWGYREEYLFWEWIGSTYGLLDEEYRRLPAKERRKIRRRFLQEAGLW